MDSEAIEHKAADWFARRESGSWTSADEAQFDEWLTESTAHRIAFIRLEAAWHHAARLQALGAGATGRVIPLRGAWGDALHFKGPAAESREGAVAESREGAAAGSRKGAATAGAVSEAGTASWRADRSGARASDHRAASILGKRWSPRWISALAASALVAVAGATYVLQSGLLDSDRYSTKIGALATVPLADGSRVTLNTDSRIRVALVESQRRIELDQGEAFFEVAKDPGRPFVVTAGRKRIVAVGTKFSVRRDHDAILVAVTEGKVRVEDAVTPPNGRGAEVLVSAGSLARTYHADVLVHDHAGSEVDQLLSWRTGYLVFRDVTLSDAVVEFNRYNARKILIQDPAIADIRIGGNFRSTNTDAFLWLLQNGFPVSVEKNADSVILKAR